MKPGYKTTEMWGSVAAGIVVWLDSTQGNLPDRYAAVISGIVAGAYALARGLAKSGHNPTRH